MISKDLKIEIRPIPNRNGIRDFSEDLEYFSQAHVLAPLVDPVTRKYVTGLSEEDMKLLKEKELPYLISDTYVKGVPHEFWESPIVKVELKNSPIFLFPGKSDIDFVKWKYLLKSSFIYSSEEEMKSGTKPQATHFIYDEGEATTLKATELQRRNSLINKISKLSLKRKRDIILIVLNENTDNKDEDYLTVRFDDILSSKEYKLQLEQLLKQNVEEVTLTAEIKSAIQKNVLRRTKKGIFYFETNLGFSEEDVKTFLSKTDNQELYLNIKSKIN